MGRLKVLVTDSHYKHSLAAVRNLGKYFNVYCCSYKRKNPTFLSRYCKKGFTHINHEIEKNEKIFVKELKQFIKKYSIDILIPIGYYTNIIVSKNKEELERYLTFPIPVAEFEKMKIATNKIKTLKIAEKAKIPFPKSFFFKSKEDIKKNIDKIKKFPVVIKSSMELKTKEKVVIVKDKKMLIRKLQERIKKCDQIVQEKITGFGCGYFGLYWKGKELCYFLHRRIREYPCTGGVSSCSESFFNEKLHMLGKKLMKKLKWDGIVMVEFKYDEKTGNFKLLEINPKFWGSLDLAISSGVEFPYYYCLLSMGKINEIKKSFKGYKYVKFQWILPEDTLRIKTCENKAKAFRQWFFDLINPKVKKDINYITLDPLPTIARGVYTWLKMLK